MDRILEFLAELERKNISYSLTSVRRAVMVEVALPGERWEVEFFSDGSVEAEQFVSDGTIRGEEAIDRILSTVT